MRHTYLLGLFGIACLAALPARAQTLYEEEPTDSMDIRIGHWKQLANYADSLKSVVDTSSPAAYAHSIESIRAQYRAWIGYPPPDFHLKNPRQRMVKIGEDEVAVYYRCFTPVAKGLEAYGLYIVPKNANKPAPLVISMHGGGGSPELATFKGGQNYHDMVRGAVAQGYVVYAPLYVQYPYFDRDKGTAIPPNVSQVLQAQFQAKGTGLSAVESAEISRAVDLLLTRPEIDKTRVGMVGLSLGGLQTVLSTSLDPRIKVAVCSCAPSFDTVNLICPRAFQLQLGDKDQFLGPVSERTKMQVEQIRALYKKVGVEDRFEFQVFDGVHEFNGKLAWEFLKKYL
jgi:dienelactone hydrolase